MCVYQYTHDTHDTTSALMIHLYTYTCENHVCEIRVLGGIIESSGVRQLRTLH